jgi:signal peptide peptidase SppA
MPSGPGGIAVIPIVGVLLKEPSWFQRFVGGTSTLETSALLGAAIADASIRAVVFYLDSPGGTVRGIGELALEIFRARAVKPIVAFASDATASAAYYLAAQASRVFAIESSLVGGIGVFAVLDDSSREFEAGGIRRHVVRSAKLKGAGVPGTEVTPEQLAEVQRMVDGAHELFVAAVARGRGLRAPVIEKLADGRVHSGRAAVELGLVDELVGTFGDVIARAAGQPASLGIRASLAELRAVAPSAGTDFLIEARREGWTVENAAAEFARREAARPASLAELQSALPAGIPAEFVSQCVADAMTTAQAVAAWAKREEAELASNRARREHQAQREWRRRHGLG